MPGRPEYELNPWPPIDLRNIYTPYNVSVVKMDLRPLASEWASFSLSNLPLYLASRNTYFEISRMEHEPNSCAKHSATLGMTFSCCN